MIERQVSEEMEWFEEICFEAYQKTRRVTGILAHQAAFMFNFRLRRTIDCYAESGYKRFKVRMTYSVETKPIDSDRSNVVGKMFLWEEGDDRSRSIVVCSGTYRTGHESSWAIDWAKEGF